MYSIIVRECAGYNDAMTEVVPLFLYLKKKMWNTIKKKKINAKISRNFDFYRIFSVKNRETFDFEGFSNSVWEPVYWKVIGNIMIYIFFFAAEQHETLPSIIGMFNLLDLPSVIHRKDINTRMNGRIIIHSIPSCRRKNIHTHYTHKFIWINKNFTQNRYNLSHLTTMNFKFYFYRYRSRNNLRRWVTHAWR